MNYELMPVLVSYRLCAAFLKKGAGGEGGHHHMQAEATVPCRLFLQPPYVLRHVIHRLNFRIHQGS